MKKEKWYRPLISRYRNYRCSKLADQLKLILDDCCDQIPVIIVCYNNGVYVKNLTKQLQLFNIKPIIIDNLSKDKETKKILHSLKSKDRAYIAYSNVNFGHFVGFLDPIYKLLPDHFAYSDPDLQLNKKLPKNFLKILLEITIKYKTYKAGFALDLLENHRVIKVSQDISITKPFYFCKSFSVRDFEERFWRFPVRNDNYELYYAPTDSTFSVYNKNNFHGNFYDAIRVAGNFAAIHLPWFPEIDIMSENQKDIYLKNSRKRDSTWIKK